MRWISALFALSVSTVSLQALAANHPSLLFSKSDVSAMRATLEGPLSGMGDGIKAGVEFPFEGGNFPKTPSLSYEYFDDRRAIADTLASYAFAALVFRGESPVGDHAMQLAKAYLDGICAYSDWVFADTQDSAEPDLNSGHFLMDVSLAYDWLYDDLTTSERDACRKRVATEGEKMLQASLGSGWWAEEYLQNHHWINNSGLGMAALAFDGEIGADTGTWLTQARQELAKAHSVLDLIQGGAWHEGIGYFGYGMDSLVPFALADRRINAQPDLSDLAILRDYSKLRMVSMPPSVEHRREYPIWGDYSGSNNDGSIALSLWAAREKKDGQAAWYAEQFRAGKTQGKGGFTSWPPSHRSFVLATVLYDASVASQAPPERGSAWALDFVAEDLSLAVSRSGWEDSGTLLAFKTGVFGGHANYDRLKVDGAPGGSLDFGHDHADDMTLFFFAEDEWLTTTVPAYYIGRDEGPGVLQGNMTKYSNSLLIDGVGQLGEGARHCYLKTCDWFFERQSSIPIRGSTASYGYFLGAGSQLYDASFGLSSFGRSILFVDRRFPVVRDVVQATSAHRFDIVYHAIDGVTRDGDWLKLDAKNEKALGVRVVSPAAFALDTQAQSAVHLDKFDSDGSMTAAYIHPESDTANVTFLTALVPSSDADWSARASVEPIDPSTPERGLVISDSDVRHDVVMADTPESNSSAAGIELVGMAGTRKIVSGKLERAALAGGSKLSLDGKPTIEIITGAPATLEVEPVSDGVKLSGQIGEALVYAPSAKHVTLNGSDIPFKQEGDRVRVNGADAPNPGSGGPGGQGGTSSTGGSSNGLEPGLNAGRGSTSDEQSGCGCRTSRSSNPALLPIAFALLLGFRRRLISRASRS